ncbi:MAG TPA: hypothetical protein VLL52_10585 [Anaerolineae bacterium]|nr:hypothetical protein [Anaerolineae bacterium]
MPNFDPTPFLTTSAPTPAWYHHTLYQTTPQQWAVIQHHALTHALQTAVRSPFHQKRVPLSPTTIAADPHAALLHFPPLTKRDYWDHAHDLRLPTYDQNLAYTFRTSGTELGVPTEMPWDEWTYQKGFVDTSALALLRVGALDTDRLLVGAAAFGALGRAFAAAAQRLNLDLFFEDSSFSDDQKIDALITTATDGQRHTLIGAPGPLVAFIHALHTRNIDPLTLNIHAIISGIGNFLTTRHLNFFIKTFQPNAIVEQAGKNEILHAPGGLRYHATQPQTTCHAGYHHFLPSASHVITVDPQAFHDGQLIPLPDDTPGILLMSRLSAGREGIVAYINDACDFGMTRGIGGLNDTPLCPCGNPMPAFRYLGRVTQTYINKLGDNLFPEEISQTLTTACQQLNLPPNVAVACRLQAIVVRDAHWENNDTLYWLVGIDPHHWPSYQTELEQLQNKLTSYWIQYPYYHQGVGTRYLHIGAVTLVDRHILPHTGRDKPNYPIVTTIDALPDQTHHARWRHYLLNERQATIFGSLSEEE